MGFLDPKALRDWIKSRAVNNLMATAKGFFLDARVGPVIQNRIDEINGNLNNLLLDGMQIRYGQVTIDVKASATASKNVYQEIVNKWGWARMYFFLPELNSNTPAYINMSVMDGVLYVHNSLAQNFPAVAVNYIAIGK